MGLDFSIIQDNVKDYKKSLELLVYQKKGDWL
jgi:hypothetical protein